MIEILKQLYVPFCNVLKYNLILFKIAPKSMDKKKLYFAVCVLIIIDCIYILGYVIGAGKS